MKSYSEKLLDPKWVDLRNEIIKERGNRCQLCNRIPINTNVHHLRYSGEPWEVDKSDLVVLCQLHHKMIHGKLETPKLKTINELFNPWADEFLRRCKGNL